MNKYKNIRLCSSKYLKISSKRIGKNVNSRVRVEKFQLPRNCVVAGAVINKTAVKNAPNLSPQNLYPVIKAEEQARKKIKKVQIRMLCSIFIFRTNWIEAASDKAPNE